MLALDAPEERIKKFKYRGKDATVRREQRAALSVELRKARRDEQVLKRRNISKPPHDPTSRGVSLTLDEIVRGVNSPDLAECFQATQAIRKMLSREKTCSLKTVVDSGVIPRLVVFLRSSHHPCLQLEAAWALTNIASGTSGETSMVVKGGAIPALVELLSSPNMTVCEQAVWALSNIAGDGPGFRDAVISSNVIPRLTALVSSTIPVTFLRNVTWALSNLCRGKYPSPAEGAVRQMLPSLSRLLQHQDPEILSDACWALSYLTDACSERIDLVVDTGVLPRLVELMSSAELMVLIPSLRTVGNVVMGTDRQTQLAIDAGMLKALPQLLQHPKSSVQKEATWALSNVAAGPHQHIQELIAHNLLLPLVSLLRSGEYKVQREAVWAVSNFTTGASADQLFQLVHSGVLGPLLNLLAVPDAKVTLIILRVLSHLLQAARKPRDKESLCLLLEELGAIDRVEALLLHENCQISWAALKIVENHFGEEEDTDGESSNAKPRCECMDFFPRD